jgi:hypothetical protein
VLGLAFLSIHFSWGWMGATAAVASSALLLAWFCLRHHNPLFAKFFAFGLCAGVIELFNDTWLVRQGILVYTPGGPFIVETPAYMPLSWALIFVTNGAIAVWLQQKVGLVKASVLMALIAACYIPGFEAIAALANWWHYERVPMLWGLAPVFVVRSEGILALPLPLMNSQMIARGLWYACAMGCLEGLVIWGATALCLFGAPT